MKLPKYKIVGFTGTRHGMSNKQKEVVKNLLVSFEASVLHHGDCVGADSQAHKIAKELKLKICIHPPKNSTFRSFCVGDMLAPAKEYLERDRTIVEEVDALIAAPLDETEPAVPSGGTWYTVNYAMNVRKKSTYIVFRNGDLVVVEHPKEIPDAERTS